MKVQRTSDSPPAVALVGPSNSGKTTLLEKLLQELTGRGYRVATVKHAPEASSTDLPGSDSWRHLVAGSAATALYGPGKLVITYQDPGDYTVAELAGLVGAGCDLLLAEGFKHDPVAKIEVHRRGHAAPLEGLENVIATATDEPLPGETAQYSLEDVSGLADLIRERLLGPVTED